MLVLLFCSTTKHFLTVTSRFEISLVSLLNWVYNQHKQTQSFINIEYTPIIETSEVEKFHFTETLAQNKYVCRVWNLVPQKPYFPGINEH